MRKSVGYLLSVICVGLLISIIKTTFAASHNLVSNASVESASNNLPHDWIQDSWGSLDATFSYPNAGQDGNRSVRVDVSNYRNGDAKWYFKPVAVQPGKTYTYETFYKASVSTEVVVQITDKNGVTTYQWLKTIPANNTAIWQRARADFTTPSTVSTISVFHVVNSNGWLQTDNTFFGQKDVISEPSEDNLLPNASLEASDDRDSNKPAWWSSNAWGNTTATFSYEATGQHGSRSVKTEVTAHTDGDAKWFVDPVTVKPNQAYAYTHFYKANTETQAVAAYIDANGNYSYEWLRSIPAAQDWQKVELALKTPSTAQKISIYHVVDRVGWLQIDNAELVEQKPQTETGVIPNASLEAVSAANANSPAHWTHNSWGNNKPTFEYATSGKSGNRSVKVTMTNYVDGDAKWYFNPVTTLTPGKQYRFSAWYKGSITPEVVAMFTKANGTTQYFGLPDPVTRPDASTTWQLYSDTFTVPKDAVSTSVFMFINKNGWIQTDDYSITPYQPVGFNRPLVTLTFDDGHEDNVTTALPLLNQYGFKSTQCYATDHIEGISQARQNVLDFYNSGHEICSHTVSHPFLTSVSQAQLDYELRHSQQVLEGIIGKPVRNFASPYGDYNTHVNSIIDDYYQSHRTVDEGYNSKDNFDIYRLRVQNVQNTTTLAELQSWIDHARATNTWLILVYHRVAPNAGQFDSYPNDFAAQLKAIKDSGLTVKTYQDALIETRSQL